MYNYQKVKAIHNHGNNQWFLIPEIVKDFVNDTKEILKDNLIKDYLFGSYAKNEQSELSDIEILIIVKDFNAMLRKDISSLSFNYSLEKDIVISPIIKDVHVWEKNKKYDMLFYREISKYGIELL